MGKPRLEVPPWVCIALIALGLIGGTVNALMSARYGQRMTVDEEGWYTQTGGILVISAFAFICALASGRLLRTRHWFGITIGVVVFVAAVSFIAFTLTNSIGFSGYQILSKSKAMASKAQAAKDIASIQRDTVLKEREETRKELWRTYTTAKTPTAKEEAYSKIEAINEAPIVIPEQAPAEGSRIVDARALILNELLGWKMETAQALSAAALPFLLVVGELLGPLLGTALWPSHRSQEAPPERPTKDNTLQDNPRLIERRFTKQEARQDVERMIATGTYRTDAASGIMLADRWGTSTATVSDWLREWKKAGVLNMKRDGKRKIVVPPNPPRLTNGAGHNVVKLTA